MGIGGGSACRLPLNRHTTGRKQHDNKISNKMELQQSIIFKLLNILQVLLLLTTFTKLQKNENGEINGRRALFVGCHGYCKT